MRVANAEENYHFNKIDLAKEQSAGRLEAKWVGFSLGQQSGLALIFPLHI